MTCFDWSHIIATGLFRTLEQALRLTYSKRHACGEHRHGKRLFDLAHSRVLTSQSTQERERLNCRANDGRDRFDKQAHTYICIHAHIPSSAFDAFTPMRCPAACTINAPSGLYDGRGGKRIPLALGDRSPCGVLGCIRLTTSLASPLPLSSTREIDPFDLVIIKVPSLIYCTSVACAASAC
jgi:hypothetical protein